LNKANFKEKENSNTAGSIKVTFAETQKIKL
jgi:hypothetical protein